MNIAAYPYSGEGQDRKYLNKTVIVVDILRASNTIIHALDNGAIQVIPARDVMEAKMYSSNLGNKKIVFAGENDGLKISGCDCGNSPLEFTPEVILDKKLVLLTSNGTIAIHNAKSAKKLLIGSLRNKNAVAATAANLGNDIVILCAGTQGECSADDAICAGGIVQAIGMNLPERPHYNDFALMCSMLYGAWISGNLSLDDIAHYQTLKKLGFHEDLKFCFEENKTDCVPYFENGCIMK